MPIEREVPANRRGMLPLVLLLLALAIGGLRFAYLAADFPNFSRWSLDQAKYTDEGWWANAAIMHQLTGHWYVAGDYNPAVAVPVWPLLLSGLFRVTGVSLMAARALSVALSLATLLAVFLLVRRFVRSQSIAAFSAVLLASSPFAYVFSRLAILDAFVVFQFCLLLLLASYAAEAPLFSLIGLAILIPAILLTKTTAAVLLPAVAWLLWSAMAKRVSLRNRIAGLTLLAAFCALAMKAYVALAYAHGYGEDYRYFFDINQLEDIDWRQTLAFVVDLLQKAMWVDRILYPLAVLAVVLSVWKLRGLWRNPLYVASGLAFAGQAAYIFLRQGNYAPRYFLPMLAPVVIVIVLAADEARLRSREIYSVLLALASAAAVINVAAILSFLHHRTYQLHDAGVAIARIVRADPQHSPMLLGISASEISLMTGLPSINDAYGTETLDRKLPRYKPGWYVAWMGIGPDEQALLAPGGIKKIASYPAFDDDERNILILYRLGR